MGNDNNGLKTFTGLAGMLNRMREGEPTCNLPKPKGPKQKREAPTDVQWQPLVEMNDSLPARLQVHLKLGKHPKTDAVQWFGFYHHGQQRLKVVCDPLYRHELPAGGEIWEVRVTKQIPGIVFAKAETSASLVATEEAERVKREEDRVLWLASAGKFVTVNMTVPQNPRLHVEDVEGAVTGYEYQGTIESVDVVDGVCSLVITDVFRASSGWDRYEGNFVTDTRRYADRHCFTFHNVEVTADSIEGYSEHRFGQSWVRVYR